MAEKHIVLSEDNFLKKIEQRSLQELRLSWRFIANDFWAAIVPGVIFTLVALKQANLTVFDTAIMLLNSLLYTWLFVYGHTLANQIVGIEEDKVNKPTRPLPIGIISLKGAIWRLVVVTCLFLLYGWWLGVFRWALLWVLTHLWMNFYSHKHWFSKNVLALGLGVCALLGAAWEMVQPLTPIGWQWVLTMSFFFGVTISLQDFRDVAGDHLLGRKTLPLVFGETKARVIISLLLMSVLAVTYWIIKPAPEHLLGSLYIAGIILLHLVISIRILLYRNPKADHQTMMLHLYLFCLYLSGGLVFI